MSMVEETRKADASTPTTFRADWLSAASFLYLAAPLAMFFLTWLKLPVGVALTAVLGFAFMRMFSARQLWQQRPRWSWVVVPVALVAFAWVLLSGLDHVVFANGDWAKHDSIFHDLANHPWPVTYFGDGGASDSILRYYVAWYLVPAALGHLFGAGLTLAFAVGWTVLGVTLFALHALRAIAHPRWRWLAIVALVGFSGLDMIGAFHTFGWYRPGLGQHIERWSELWTYNSFTTLLFWAPQQALPGWLFAAVFVRWWKSLPFAQGVGLWLAVMVLWSPLTTVGAAPFAAFVLVHHMRRSGVRTVVRPLLLAGTALIVAIPALYLTQGLGGNPAGWAGDGRPEHDVLTLQFLWFIPCEVLALVVIAWLIGPLRNRLLAMLAVLVLVAITFFRFGVFNDLAMRGSIVALTVLFFVVLQAIDGRTKRNRRSWTGVLAVMLAFIGAMTPFGELSQAFIAPSNPPTDRGVLEQLGIGGYEVPDSQYVSTITSPILRAAMRTSTPLYDFGSGVNLQPSQWVPHCDCVGGAADVSTNRLHIQSSRPVSAYYASTMTFSPGLYRVRLSYSYAGAHEKESTAHVSVPGFSKVAELDETKGQSILVTKYLYIPPSIGSQSLVVGVGGWGTPGTGTLDISSFTIQPVSTARK